jgi:hypothetical protein
MRVGKNAVPGAPESNFNNGAFDTIYLLLVKNLTDSLVNGFPEGGGSSPMWYRVLAKPPRSAGPGTQLKRVSVASQRAYVGTQRRRLVPHGT